MQNLQIYERSSTIQVRVLPSKIFCSYESLNVLSQENYYQQATCKDKVPTFSKPSAALLVQETDCLNAYVATRSAYDEHIEVCPRGTQAPRLHAR